MHFNIYIDDETGQDLNRAVERGGESRNALIRKAVREWLERQGRQQWPEIVLGFEGVPDLPPFEAGREQFKPLADDPLA